MITREFILAGKAIFTLEVAPAWADANGTPAHWTFKVRGKELDDGSGNRIFFVSLLTGPDNESDYAYLGVLNPETGEVRLTKASKFSETTLAVRLVRRVFARIWAGEQGAIEASDLKCFAIRRLYNDACDVGIAILSPTGTEKRFNLVDTDVDGEGEVQGWRFNPVDGIGPSVLVIND
jgi:hypothetical protein